jgi:hypothetical protein
MPQGCIHISKEASHQWRSQPTTIARWHQALCLPDSYRVLEVRSGPGCQFGEMWVIIVESESIPDIEGRVLPEVVPIYSRDAGGNVRLEHIETRIWDSVMQDWRALDGVA